MPTNNVEDGGKTVNQPFEAYSPKISLNQVVLNEDVKQQIKVAITAVKNRRKMLEDWKMPKSYFGSRAVILNFYGKAGTGKSMAAEAIADTLGKKVYKINYSELESKYVGETPKNIRRAFDCASKDDAVLIFDEADSFLGKRLTSVTQSSDYGVNITRSVLLMELEKFEGVVVFTTNLIKNYDEAFKRRILLSVYFDMPDEEAREAIWRMHINPEMPIAPDVTMEELAKRFTDVSGADIRDTVFYAALHALEQGKETIGYDSFDYAYSAIRERYRDHEIEDSIEIISDERIPVDQVKKTEEKNGGDC
jgi:SpoVK/Ycf46/Vps4 family AAA+-type ATPase